MERTGGNTHIKSYQLESKNTDDKGETPMFIALECAYFNRVKFLLKNGANVNVSNENAQTALAIAAQTGNVDLVQDFLDRGAKVDISVNYLQFLWTDFRSRDREFCENNAAKIVELLLGHGAHFQWLPDAEFVNHRNIHFIKPIIACLAIQELYENHINPFLQLKIHSHRYLTYCFTVLKKELEELRVEVAYKSVTFSDILNRSSENISHFLYKLEFIKNFHNLIYSSSDYYYKGMIHYKIRKAVHTANLRQNSIPVISKITGINSNVYPYIISRIASFLNHLDLENLCFADNIYIY